MHYTSVSYNKKWLGHSFPTRGDFIRSFILNGQTRVREIIDTDETISEDEDMSTEL